MYDIWFILFAIIILLYQCNMLKTESNRSTVNCQYVAIKPEFFGSRRTWEPSSTWRPCNLINCPPFRRSLAYEEGTDKLLTIYLARCAHALCLMHIYDTKRTQYCICTCSGALSTVSLNCKLYRQPHVIFFAVRSIYTVQYTYSASRTLYVIMYV